MTEFPTLKSGAVQQYPSTKTETFVNHRVTFLDGTEQRYRSTPGALRRWIINLNQLDEGEIGTIEQFFIDQQGSFGSFAFTDPFDGTVYPDCSIENDIFDVDRDDELRAKTNLTVKENRI